MKVTFSKKNRVINITHPSIALCIATYGDVEAIAGMLKRSVILLVNHSVTPCLEPVTGGQAIVT
jgi:hypothetical protein